eukprot:3002393-Rhodomonas_salina.2
MWWSLPDLFKSACSERPYWRRLKRRGSAGQRPCSAEPTTACSESPANDTSSANPCSSCPHARSLLRRVHTFFHSSDLFQESQYAAHAISVARCSVHAPWLRRTAGEHTPQAMRECPHSSAS